ncbi:hypothetical protein [Actinomadura keratinilytica]|jgi:tetratricopeptide (TPR) repeat protein
MAAAVAPEVLQEVLHESTAEAMEFTQRANATAIGRGTFAHLESALAALDRSYNIDPPAAVFSTARAYRLWVAELIDGPRTLKEARELYVCAAWFSETLAWLAHDLGDPLGAEAWAIDAFEHAEQAGHDELCAWATDAMASIAIYNNRPARALAAAQRGIAKAAARHPLAVRLRAQAARAHARLGDRDAVKEMFRQAGEVYERLPARAPLRFDTSTGHLATFAMTSYPASAYIWLGDAECGDFAQARTYAQAAIDAQLALPAASRSPSREAIARIDLAIALTKLGEPEQAAALGQQALGTSRLVDSVRSRAGDLEHVLTVHYPDLPVVRDLQEAYRQNRPTR